MTESCKKCYKGLDSYQLTHDLDELLCLENAPTIQEKKPIVEKRERWYCLICNVDGLDLDESCFKCKKNIYYYMQYLNKDIEEFTNP
jgi:hypothetical protein